MGPIWLSGGMPDRITEATRPWEWIANLRMAFDPALVRFVEVVGSGGDIFDAWLDRRLGLVTIAPIALPDHEAFARENRAPEVSVQLRFHMANGTVADGAQTWRVAVENLDDTPPESVAFATGGTVRAGEAGAVVGRLRVTDPDTASGFRFSFLPEDEWMFEIVNGDTLKLRDGVLIPREDAPVRPLILEVSDGANSSAHVLEIQVEAGLSGLPRGAQLTGVLERSGPLFLPNPDTARLDLPASQVAGVNGYAQVLEVARPGGQPSLWFERTLAVDLLDGLLDADPNGTAFRVALAYDALLQRAPTASEMMWANAALVSGAGVRAVTADILGGAEFRARPAQPLESLFRQVSTELVGWAEQSGIDRHTAAVRSGTYTTAVAVEEYVNWAAGIDYVRARAAEGLWVPHVLADQLLAINRVGTGVAGFDGLGSEARVHAVGGMLWHAAGSLAEGPAFQARFGGMGNAAFVDAVFREVLGRGPSSWAEFTRFWSPLESGQMSRGEVLFHAVTRLDPAPVPPPQAPGGHAIPHLLTHGIGEMLDVVFGAATPAAWRSADARMAMDGALRQAAREVAATPEFRARYAALDNPGYIDKVFVEAYGVPVDWAGFSRLYFPLSLGWMGRGDIVYAAASDPRAFAQYQPDLTFDLL